MYILYLVSNCFTKTLKYRCKNNKYNHGRRRRIIHNDRKLSTNYQQEGRENAKIKYLHPNKI